MQLKDLYSHEINFKGKVGDTDHIYRILPLPPRGGNERRRKNFPNALFVTMFCPTTVSDTTAKKAFLEFGEVHDGKLKKPFNNISNGKRHIRLLSIKPSMTFLMKYSLMTLRFFRSRGLRRKYNAKSVCTHAVILVTQIRYLANEDSLPDNVDITLASTMKTRDERVTTKDAAPNSNTVAAAALRGRASTHSSEMP